MFTRSAAKQTFTNWELAILVNVIYEKEEEGKVTRCKLDLNCTYITGVDGFTL